MRCVYDCSAKSEEEVRQAEPTDTRGLRHYQWINGSMFRPIITAMLLLSMIFQE